MTSAQQSTLDLNAPKPPDTPQPDPLVEIDTKIEENLIELGKKRGSSVYPLLLRNTSIGGDLVDDVFDDLRKKFTAPVKRMEVILDSGGGDIHAAYNIGLLLRRFATEELNFILPRWAKSAATLLACAGQKIFMLPVAEMGPIDPQITQMNPLESRLEQFSPLDIEATLELIRTEFKTGEERLAKGLLERLQFPLTLGGFKKSLSIGKEYLSRLLTTGMFKGQDARERVDTIGKTLVEGYSDHSFCIDISEALQIGLIVEELQEEELSLAWDIIKLNKKKARLEKEKKEKEMQDILKQMPPGLLKLTPRSAPHQGNGKMDCSSGSPKQGGFMYTEQESTSAGVPVDKIDVAVRIATEILRQKGEITLDHIQAIPFLDGQRDTDMVVSQLLRSCNAEISQRKIESEPVLRWERFIRLKR